VAALAGLRGTGDWGADERPTSFREGIMYYRPNGTAPIFGLTSKSKSKTITDPQHSWWAEGQTLTRLQVNGALGTTDTLVTVDSADPTATTAAANYGTATNLKQGDVLLVEPATDDATFDQELIEVVAVQSATQFTVKRGAGGTSADTISNDGWLTLVGSAYAEGTDIPPPTTRNPVNFTNYLQIFKDTYELTKTADATTTRTGDAWSNDKRRKAFDHSKAIEWAFMFGRKAETVGENGKPKRFTGGLREFIPAANTTVFSAPVTPALLQDALTPIFDFDTDAGDTRMGFGGNAALTELGKVIQNVSGVRINYDKKITQYGIDFTEFIMPRGRILFYSHPLLNLHPLYKYSIFVLDFSSITYLTLPGRDTKAKDDVQTDSEDVRRGFWQTECGVMVDFGGLTNAYLGNVRAS